MMNRRTVLEELEEKAVKELHRLTRKENITPSELEAMTKVTCLLEKIDILKEEENGYSERYYPRGPEMTRSSYRNSEEGRSYERGRSRTTGRYMSRDYGGDQSQYDGGYGYSGHSIKDRMISRLETMMDEAESPYEKQVVEKWIKRLSEE